MLLFFVCFFLIFFLFFFSVAGNIEIQPGLKLGSSEFCPDALINWAKFAQLDWHTCHMLQLYLRNVVFVPITFFAKYLQRLPPPK